MQTSGTELDAGSTSSTAGTAALWLTSRAVEGFDANDFNDLPEAERDELQNSVTAFRHLADTIPPQSPPTDEQYRNGLNLLQRIFSIVRKPILDEWSDSVEQLISEAEEWARERGWSSRRESKTVRERLLDTYDLSQLLIQINGSTLLLDPIVRFVPGALGVADLALVPSYHSVRIPRREDGWHLHIDPDRRGGGESQSLWKRGVLRACRRVVEATRMIERQSASAIWLSRHLADDAVAHLKPIRDSESTELEPGHTRLSRIEQIAKLSRWLATPRNSRNSRTKHPQDYRSMRLSMSRTDTPRD